MFEKKKLLSILLLLSFALTEAQSYYPPWISVYTSVHGVPWYTQYFCKNNTGLVLAYVANYPSIYYVWIKNFLDTGSVIEVKFDAHPTLFINNEHFLINNSRFIKDADTVNNVYTFEFVNNTKELHEILRVEGNTPYHTTHITSFKINGDEKCQEPDLDIFESDNRYGRLPASPDKFCGRRKVNIDIDESSLVLDKPGFWPWHVAIQEFQDGKTYYICGGTLISIHTVLTAASCVVIGNATVHPEVFEVILGHFLNLDDAMVQKVKVSHVIFHDEYDYSILNNDIALLKLGSEVQYNNYVQPACLWFDGITNQINIDTSQDLTSAVRWDSDETISNKSLNIAILPIVADETCILYQPVFYHRLLNGLKFCAGPQNDTLRYNAKGGAYMVFIEDYKLPKTLFGSNRKAPGAWYVKGILSTTLKNYKDDGIVSNPDGYAVFTDIAKYRHWITAHMDG